MENRNWIIIVCRTEKPLHGINYKTLRFSSYAIAKEVAIQFFDKDSDFTIFNINDIKK